MVVKALNLLQFPLIEAEGWHYYNIGIASIKGFQRSP
ncbi:MAG: hypothetical protein DCF22_09060 [Leptolyngbya sp.]|nr:MAG: hypothetical protein DCF22_09060 [Leptolyngbya sp.]